VTTDSTAVLGSGSPNTAQTEISPSITFPLVRFSGLKCSGNSGLVVSRVQQSGRGKRGLALKLVPRLAELLAELTNAARRDIKSPRDLARGVPQGQRLGNPAIAFLFRKFGVLGTFALMGVVWSLFITLRWWHQGVDVQTAVAFAYWLVPMNNLIVLIKLRRRAARS